MPRNISFALTTAQIENRTKDVTRRFGWWNVKPGETLWAVKKAMGLKKGEKIEHLTLIRVVSARQERLDAITADDCVREGFPDLTPAQFVAFLCHHHKVTPEAIVNRIEFEYMD